ncbi:sensor histidine kinase [Peredibacter starrii]|uniref:histidine kinase n=1 Tax=Peredibacter starrii TaxID=28202 RepID=A0AAX4HLQ2_9BACT|nr:ATP-binding protein [Peredibacter starrii]WPU64125.1 ATP-binding protein [Peredibacter starrii]
MDKAKFFELGMMSAGIAHEINNPLTIIQARTTQLLRIYRNPEQQKELAQGLQQILYTTDRIDRTIKSVRNVFYQQDQLPYERIELKTLLDNVLVFCGQRLQNHGIELRLSEVEGIYLRGHEVQLEQVFVNLVNNSLDAIDGENEKWIELSTVQRNGYIDIYFKDSGNGISPEVVEHMMEPFFSTKGNKGTGLGLTLINAILHKHGGNISYVPNAPHTTFLIELPMDERGARGVNYESFSIQ